MELGGAPITSQAQASVFRVEDEGARRKCPTLPVSVPRVRPDRALYNRRGGIKFPHRCWSRSAPARASASKTPFAFAIVIPRRPASACTHIPPAIEPQIACGGRSSSMNACAALDGFRPRRAYVVQARRPAGDGIQRVLS